MSWLPPLFPRRSGEAPAPLTGGYYLEPNLLNSVYVSETVSTAV